MARDQFIRGEHSSHPVMNTKIIATLDPVLPTHNNPTARSEDIAAIIDFVSEGKRVSPFFPVDRRSTFERILLKFYGVVITRLVDFMVEMPKEDFERILAEIHAPATLSAKLLSLKEADAHARVRSWGSYFFQLIHQGLYLEENKFKPFIHNKVAGDPTVWANLIHAVGRYLIVENYDKNLPKKGVLYHETYVGALYSCIKNSSANMHDLFLAFSNANAVAQGKAFEGDPIAKTPLITIMFDVKALDELPIIVNPHYSGVKNLLAQGSFPLYTLSESSKTQVKAALLELSRKNRAFSLTESEIDQAFRIPPK